MKRSVLTALTAACLPLTFAACDLGGPLGPSRIDVRFAADMSSSNGTLASVLGDGAGSLGALALSSIDSINVTITGVDAAGAEGGFASLQLQQDALGRLNLLALPTDDENSTAGIALAQGTVPAGTYNGVRLRYDVTTATITLNEDVTVGQHTFTAGTHPLEVPSGAQNGIKVMFSSLSLGDDQANVVLTFDGGVTIQNVTATGSGKLLLAPVLRVRAEEIEES